MKFRKKPADVEAWHWKFAADQEKAPTWIKDAMFRWPEIGGMGFEPDHADGPRICVATLDGVAIVSPGDWIIKSAEGEILPCKPDIFAATYEPVEEASD